MIVSPRKWCGSCSMRHVRVRFISQNKVVGQGHIFIYIYLICPILFGKLNLREREPCLYHVWVLPRMNEPASISGSLRSKKEEKNNRQFNFSLQWFSGVNCQSEVQCTDQGGKQQASTCAASAFSWCHSFQRDQEIDDDTDHAHMSSLAWIESSPARCGDYINS